MYRHRWTYWSCTKLADYIRGLPKLSSGTCEQWRNWKTVSKHTYPIRYWIAEEGLDYIQDFIYFPADVVHKIRCYIKNRYVHKLHYLSTGLKPGPYYELDHRLIHGMFNEIVNFVEIDKAHMQLTWGSDDENSSEENNFKYPIFNWFRTWRCPEAGLTYLKWEASLVWKKDEVGEDKSELVGKPTQQAIAAQEILKIYDWWKNIRPKREDPMDLSGWSAYCEEKREKAKLENPEVSQFDSLFIEEKTDEERAKARSILDKCEEIEKQQNDEDEEMMKKVISIRRHLWC